ncbi:OsmC family peroxiredoxin [Ruania alkalisoli]|uniref:OsmC family peroxiredoxin n=1 Tax=Ruania alkalisoli TaxID=2779775 RepID=A0A7M1SYN1_9MICO|nr:OsmC family peroxiredoxin [Ruania alkalisoli]QOR72680.1 OsmC family peroxiredoxin [Ruania alkalisoli]
MAVVSNASTAWTGDLFNGSGRTTFDTSGLGTFDVSWKARTEPGAGTTTPEELIAAAHASCFSMAFSNELASNGTPPESVNTAAEVTFEPGTGITGIALTVSAVVAGISEEDFQRIAAAAKDGCPVSGALRATPITLSATLAA